MLPASALSLLCSPWPIKAATARALASADYRQLLHGLVGSPLNTHSSTQLEQLPSCHAAHTQLLPTAAAGAQSRLPLLTISTHASASDNCRVHFSRPNPWQIHLHGIHTEASLDTQKATTQKPATPTLDVPEQPTLDTSAVVDSIWTPPNMLSVARAVSGPFIAALILQNNWPWALAATAVSGLSDWADGALARHMGQTSVLGSYLDPLADKVLVACVVGALAAQGNAPMWLAVLVVGRDVGLVTGTALHRWRALGWRVRGVTPQQFFSTTAGSALPLMKPLFISKVNTVLQLGLVSSCMTHAWVQLPSSSALRGLEALTAATTAASLGAYMWSYATGRLLPLPQEQSQGR